MGDDIEYVFHLSGDDHEERLITATSEAHAREICADRFNAQYPCDCGGGPTAHTDDCSGGDYDGDEFDLLGVYRPIGDVIIDADEIEQFRDDLEAVATWL